MWVWALRMTRVRLKFAKSGCFWKHEDIAAGPYNFKGLFRAGSKFGLELGQAWSTVSVRGRSRSRSRVRRLVVIVTSKLRVGEWIIFGNILTDVWVCVLCKTAAWFQFRDFFLLHLAAGSDDLWPSACVSVSHPVKQVFSILPCLIKLRSTLKLLYE